MARADLDEFVGMLPPRESPPAQADMGGEKNPEGRWRMFTYEEIVARDKCSLDIFWLRDEIPRRFLQATKTRTCWRLRSLKTSAVPWSRSRVYLGIFSNVRPQSVVRSLDLGA